MSISFIRFQLRSARLLWLSMLSLVAGVAILKSEPLMPYIQSSNRHNSYFELMHFIMVLVGLSAGWQVHFESSGVSVWLGTRGLTRRTEYLSRCATGLLIISSCVGLVALLITLGIRQGIQQSMNSPWYPMVRWLELRCLPGMIVHSLVPFGFVSFFLACSRTRDWLPDSARVVLAFVAAVPISICTLGIFTFMTYPG